MNNLVEEKQESWSGWGDFLGNIGSGGKWTKKILLSFLEQYRDNFLIASSAELLILLENAGLEYKLNQDKSFKKLILNEEGTEDRRSAVDQIIENAKKELESKGDVEDEDGDDLNTDDSLSEAEVSEAIDIDPTSKIVLTPNQILDGFKLYDHDYINMENFSAETIKFLIDSRINKLWSSFIKGHVSLNDIDSTDGEKYFNLIKKTFLEEYSKVATLELDEDYCFEHKPNLMQKLTALRLEQNKVYGNWSGTGAGKTLSAVLSGRNLKLKNTLIVSFNSTLDGWANSIHSYYDNSICHEKITKDTKLLDGAYNYVIVNYQFFQQQNAEAKLNKFLNENNIHYFVLDEVQSVKQRDEEIISNRRELMEKFINSLKNNNPDLYMLIMTATPVINNLYEAKKLLELIYGKKFNDYSTHSKSVKAGLNFHKIFSISGMRFVPDYKMEKRIVPVNIDGSHLLDNLNNVTNDSQIEQILLQDKLQAVKKFIKKGTVIYSYYVEGIIDEVEEFVKELGFTVGVHTGSRKDGLDDFRNQKVDVLIGSAPIGTGVDGIQKVSNRMICLSLPWTSAEFDQLVGRIHRQGSNFENEGVDIIIPKVDINYNDSKTNNIKTWSRDRHKWNIIIYKHDLFSIVVDGVIPDGIVSDLTSIRSKSIKTLDDIISKVKTGEIKPYRDEIEKIFIEDVEFEALKRKLGDFSKLNKDWSLKNSKNLHKEINVNPNLWKAYHKIYREARKTWDEIPYEVIGNKINHLNRKDALVADLGCGENLLSNEIENKVKAFDHFAIDDMVTVADISNLPLEDSSVDIAVLSLAMMGSNSSEYISEAHRILKGMGVLFIAEPKNKWIDRLDDLKSLVTNEGFSIVGDFDIRERNIYVKVVKL